MPSGLPFIPWTLRFPHDGVNLGYETRACVGETCCVWKCPRHPFTDLRDVMRPWDWGEFSCAGPRWPLPQPSIITLTQRHWPADWRLKRWLRWSSRRGLAEMGSAQTANWKRHERPSPSGRVKYKREEQKKILFISSGIG